MGWSEYPREKAAITTVCSWLYSDSILSYPEPIPLGLQLVFLSQNRLLLRKEINNFAQENGNLFFPCSYLLRRIFNTVVLIERPQVRALLTSSFSTHFPQKLASMLCLLKIHGYDTCLSTKKTHPCMHRLSEACPSASESV